MQWFSLNTIVSANFDSIASLTGKEEQASSILDSIHFSTNDALLYGVSFIGLLLLAFVIIGVMNRKKVSDTD